VVVLIFGKLVCKNSGSGRSEVGHCVKSDCRVGPGPGESALIAPAGMVNCVYEEQVHTHRAKEEEW
jgi:hypothetical protein